MIAIKQAPGPIVLVLCAALTFAAACGDGDEPTSPGADQGPIQQQDGGGSDASAADGLGGASESGAPFNGFSSNAGDVCTGFITCADANDICYVAPGATKGICVSPCPKVGVECPLPTLPGSWLLSTCQVLDGAPAPVCAFICQYMSINADCPPGHACTGKLTSQKGPAPARICEPVAGP